MAWVSDTPLHFLLLLIVSGVDPVFYTDRCAVVTQWWTGSGELVPVAQLVIGATYAVFLQFEEGVSVSTTPLSTLCQYWCPGEVLYYVTFEGSLRVCNYRSAAEPASTLTTCIRCDHYCAHRRNTHYGDSSVDACRESNPLSPLVWFWRTSIFNQSNTPDVLQWLTAAHNPVPCLRALSGVDLRTVVPTHCKQRLAPACFASGALCLRPTRFVQCRIKAWGAPATRNNLAGCDTCVIDYLRTDEDDSTVLFYGPNGDAPFKLLIKLCPGTPLVGWGGHTTHLVPPAPRLAEHVCVAAVSLGFAGIQVEVGPVPVETAIALINCTATYGLQLHYRVRTPDSVAPTCPHCFVIGQYTNSTSHLELRAYTETLMRHNPAVPRTKLFIKVPLEHEVVSRKGPW
ncbi:ORF45 [Ranid herpesvirus 1]|uniref:ORF45 n=1 Tax=Ranid herpesvirus 1 TaxID=85655 RepID=Q14VR3_9VIRU|nr:ORF45 [Ranid herpesvirus 1]ABG25741.1 ORF45 [Ranid herpesvirus 1]